MAKGKGPAKKGKAQPKRKSAKNTGRAKKPASTRKKKATKKKAAAKRSSPTAKPSIREWDGNGSIRLIAKLLGHSDSTLRSHIENGAPVEARSGKNQAATLNITVMHKYLLGLAQGDGSPLANAKLARQQEDLRKMRRENDEAEGRLIPIEEANFFFEQILVLLANSLDGVAGKASGGDPVVRAKIQDETGFIRVQLFNSIVEFLRSFSGDSKADSAIAEAQQLGVGERKQDSSSGNS